jgi:hypothetical protein
MPKKAALARLPDFRDGAGNVSAQRRIQERRHCTFVCKLIDDELSRTQRVCEAVGDDSLSAELSQTVVTLSDEWTKYQRLPTTRPTSRRHRQRVPWSRLRT